jgi:hypothetical protein
MKKMRKIRVVKLGIFLGLGFDWEKSGKRGGWGGGGAAREKEMVETNGKEVLGRWVVRLFGMDSTV